jgi:hypothetical protein
MDPVLRFPLKTRRRYDKSYFWMVGIALLPALGVSIMAQVYAIICHSGANATHMALQWGVF